jgi:hypothetical protein
MSAIVIGIDGGGSKTRAVVADERGTEIVHVDGPGSAVRPGRVEHSADVIAECVRDALAAANMEHVVPRVLCVGVAGVGRDAEREALWQALASRELADDVVVRPDATVALDDAFGDGPGVLLIAGTGSVAFGRSPTGTFARCGGWGPVIGDEGSGAWIGRRAINVVVAASDGREPETALTNALLTAAQVNEVIDFIPWAAAATPGRLRDARAGGAGASRRRATSARTRSSASPSRSWWSTCARSHDASSSTSARRRRWRSQVACSRAVACCASAWSSGCARRCRVRRCGRRRSSPRAARCAARCASSARSSADGPLPSGARRRLTTSTAVLASAPRQPERQRRTRRARCKAPRHRL